ncbi:MAG: hypothetical protein OEY20_04520 [Gemmatimonadota bacterium]|nr:hypothetical protein [Gemmatimonadota bacterium]MDH5196493.1 hypothetical protein [Gemmatimonadota bacterium]
MGYDLHITRRPHWSDTGNEITAEEWLACVERDPELCLRPEHGPWFTAWAGPSGAGDAWLDWDDGRIYAKNPEPTLIDKMTAIAEQLGATVQGDDGETYPRGSDPPRQPTLSFSDRVTGWIAGFRSRRPLMPDHPPLPFRVGDRVRDTWGNAHTILEIDSAAQHGLGVIRTRRDDGTELRFALVAHGLAPIRETDE